MSFSRNWTNQESEAVEEGVDQLLTVDIVNDVTEPGMWNFAMNDYGEMDIEIPDEINSDIGPDNEAYTTVTRT